MRRLRWWECRSSVCGGRACAGGCGARGSGPRSPRFTLLDGVLLERLPFYDRGTGSFVGGLLLAGFVNLIAVAVLAPLAGLAAAPPAPRPAAVRGHRLRGHGAARGDLRSSCWSAGSCTGPAVAAEREDVAAAAAATHDYVVQPGAAPTRAARGHGRAPGRGRPLPLVRPGPDPDRWLCLFVNTTQRPAGVTADSDQTPNSQYRVHGGFR